ncbi:MAG TPA: cysteine desulfurase family protein [Bacteroidota bacterium]|nr:cysteine desulfurase family protein [Bacteroidota bacterium]
MKNIYLDHTATTPLDERVLQAMLPYFSHTFGNASSVHSFGRESKQALEEARARIAHAIGAEPGELFFTSGGTESDNLAILGRSTNASERTLVLTSRSEHHAVLEPCRYLAERGGEAIFLPVDAEGVVELDSLRKAVGQKPALVSIMHSNNETGAISPLEEISQIAHAEGCLVHSDAVQSLGKLPLDVRTLGLDLASFSAHKVYGPKGIGALYVRKGTALAPIIRGGGQERGLRPGTENVPLAVGFAEAVRLVTENREAESARLSALRDGLEMRLREAFPELLVNGAGARRLPHVLNVSFDSTRMPLEGEMLVMNMDLEGVALTSGSACTSGSLQPSHVLLALGRDELTAKATLRFSFGRANSEEDVKYAAGAVKRVIAKMHPRKSS